MDRHPGDDLPRLSIPATVEGELSLDFDVSVDHDGSVSGGAFGVFDATSLRCPTCDLVLDSPSLVNRSGAMEGFEVPWEDVRALEDYDSERSWAAWEAAGFPGRDDDGPTHECRSASSRPARRARSSSDSSRSTTTTGHGATSTSPMKQMTEPTSPEPLSRHSTVG